MPCHVEIIESNVVVSRDTVLCNGKLNDQHHHPCINTFVMPNSRPKPCTTCKDMMDILGFELRGFCHVITLKSPWRLVSLERAPRRLLRPSDRFFGHVLRLALVHKGGTRLLVLVGHLCHSIQSGSAQVGGVQRLSSSQATLTT